MEQIITYIKPELIIVAIALYFVGIGLKQSQGVKDKYIPLILGIIGIVLCLIWTLASSTICGIQNALMAIFTAIVQGVLVAGASTYVNQIIKQHKKTE